MLLGSELPTPPTNVTLKYIALGFGIQNYSCSAAGTDAAATGALAMLYDITNLYPGRSSQSLSAEAFSSLTSTAIDGHDVPLNFNSSTTDRVVATSLGADTTNPFTPDAPLELDGLAAMPFLGHHFFNSAGSPQFVLGGGSQVLVAKKLDAVAAPSNANAGPDGTGAVAWLFLGDNGGSQGLTYVYRVLTAGGNSHGCNAAGADSTSYTATYWFYD